MTTLIFHADTSRFQTDRRTGEEPRLVRLSYFMPGTMKVPVCELILPPDNVDFRVDEKAFAFHGVDLRACTGKGARTLPIVMAAFEAAWRDSDRHVAFNAPYHDREVERATAAAGIPMQENRSGTVCLLKAAESVLAIPAMRPGGGFKSPSIAEVRAHYGIPMLISDDPAARGRDIVSALNQIDLALHPGIAR